MTAIAQAECYIDTMALVTLPAFVWYGCASLVPVCVFLSGAIWEIMRTVPWYKDALTRYVEVDVARGTRSTAVLQLLHVE